MEVYFCGDFSRVCRVRRRMLTDWQGCCELRGMLSGKSEMLIIKLYFSFTFSFPTFVVL